MMLRKSKSKDNSRPHRPHRPVRHPSFTPMALLMQSIDPRLLVERRACLAPCPSSKRTYKLPLHQWKLRARNPSSVVRRPRTSGISLPSLVEPRVSLVTERRKLSSLHRAVRVAASVL